MHLIYQHYTRNSGTKTIFVEMPKENTEQYKKIYIKLYGKPEAICEIDKKQSENGFLNEAIDMVDNLTPDCFLDSNVKFSYKRRGLKKNLTDVSYTLPKGEVVYPTEKCVGMSKKEWDLLFELWKDYGTNTKKKTAYFRRKEKRFLELIKIIKSADFVNDLTVYDIMV